MKTVTYIKRLAALSLLSGALQGAGEDCLEPPIPPLLQPLIRPEGLQWPDMSKAIPIPTIPTVQQDVRLVDIRPPVALVATLSEMRLSAKNQVGAIELSGEHGNCDELFKLVCQLLTEVEIGYEQLPQGPLSLKTEWYHIGNSTEGWPLEGQCQLTFEQTTPETTTITLDLLNIQRAVIRIEEEEPDLPEPMQALSMENTLLVDRLLRTELNWLATSIADNLVNLDRLTTVQERESWQVTQELDSTGMPRMVVKAEFAEVWDGLPDLLSRLHFEILERYRSKGLLLLRYIPPDDPADWKKAGLPDPDISAFYCQLQVGDLGNRCFLQLLDNDHLPFESEDFSVWLPLFIAAAEQPEAVDTSPGGA